VGSFATRNEKLTLKLRLAVNLAFAFWMLGRTVGKFFGVLPLWTVGYDRSQKLRLK
jgi:hypothetical protein